MLVFLDVLIFVNKFWPKRKKKKDLKKMLLSFGRTFFWNLFLFLEVKTRLLMHTEHMSKSMNVDSLLEQFLPNSLELNASLRERARRMQAPGWPAGRLAGWLASSQ
jgi:hypothetical protein